MKKVLFLCTGNSCRSQMAEGWARHLLADQIEAYSAGIETHGMNPSAVKAMAEAGVDITSQRSKLVDEVLNVGFDLVISVCDHAEQHCPAFPGRVRRLHVPFPDPPKLAQKSIYENDPMNAYREVRDEIRDFVKDLPALIAELPPEL